MCRVSHASSSHSKLEVRVGARLGVRVRVLGVVLTRVVVLGATVVVLGGRGVVVRTLVLEIVRSVGGILVVVDDVTTVERVRTAVHASFRAPSVVDLRSLDEPVVDGGGAATVVVSHQRSHQGRAVEAAGGARVVVVVVTCSRR